MTGQPRTTSWRLLTTGGWYGIAGAAPAVTGIAVLPFATRVLPVNAFGQVALAMTLIPLLAMVLGLGLPAAITRQAIIDHAGFAGARGLHVQGLGLLAASVGFGVAAAPLVLRDLTLDLIGGPVAVVALVVASGLGAAVVSAQAYFRARNGVAWFVASSLLAGPLGATLGLGAAYFIERTATTFLFGLVGGYAIAALASTLALANEGSVFRSRSALAAALRIGLPTIPHSLALGLAAGGLVLVAGLSGTLQLAAEARIVLSIAMGAGLVVTSLNNAWAPAVYRASGAQLVETLRSTTRTIAWLAAVSGGIVASLSIWIVRILAPPDYDYISMTVAVSIASVGPVLHVAYLSSAHLIFASGRTVVLAGTTPLGVALGLAAAMALVPRWGLTGIAVGFLVSYGALALFTTVAARYVSSVRWSPVAVVGPLAVSGLTCAISVVLSEPSSAGIAVRLVLVGVLCSFAIAGAMRLRAPEDDCPSR